MKFQICALKQADSGSLTRRRQEVGRGMRLCVNEHGVRQDFELIGEQVHEVNKLTVIASESYEAFAKGQGTELERFLCAQKSRLGAKSDKQMFGFEETGAKVVMFSNCPNNTLPIFHAETSSWTPLFPRVNRQ